MRASWMRCGRSSEGQSFAAVYKGYNVRPVHTAEWTKRCIGQVSISDPID